MDLFFFTRERPHVDLTPHLANTSLQFRNYIQRGLMQVCMSRIACGAHVKFLHARVRITKLSL